MLDLDPGNSDVARELAPVYRAQGRWADLVRVSEVLLEAADTPPARLDIMRAIWTLYEDELSDLPEAFRWCGRAFTESADVEVAVDLERLADRTDNWEELVVLGRDVVDRLTDPDHRLRFYLRMGAICMDRLAWVDDAITYYREALLLDPEEQEALDALEHLHARTEAWDDLVEVLGRKAELTSDPEARVAILFRKAELFEDILDRPEAAVDAFTAVLDVEVDSLQALAGLERLREQAEDWPALAAVVTRQLELAADEEARADRTFRLAKIHETRLDEPARALDLYREALLLAPGGPQVVERLEVLMGSASVGVAAARLLEPIYREREQWAKLARALEVALEGGDDVASRVATLKSVAQLAYDKLSDPRRAFDSLGKALALTPEDRGLWEDLDALAAELGAWSDLVRAFDQAIESGALLGEDQIDLALRVANRRQERLDKPEAAAQAFERVLEMDPENDEATDALVALYTRVSAWEDLVRTLDRKASRTAKDGERLDLYLKVCDLFEEVLDDPERAAEYYRQVLGIDGHNLVALTALERIYEDADRWTDLADVLRSQIEALEGRAAAPEARFRLARVLEEHLGEPEQAVETYRLVLIDGPHEDSVAALELLMEEPPEELADRDGFVRRVTEVLEPAYRAADLWPRLVRALEVRLGLSEEPDERVALLRQIAALKEDSGSDPAGATTALGQALLEAPGNVEVRKDLERLAQARDRWPRYLEVLTEAVDRSDDPRVRISLLRRAAEVADGKLGRSEDAEPLYRRLLEEDPADEAALDALDQLLRRMGRFEDVVEVLERKIELAEDDAAVRRLLHAVAELHDTVLDDRDRAIETYQRALGQAPDDLDSIAALERLLEASERWEELVAVYQIRASLQTDSAVRKATLARIAVAYDEHLSQWIEAVAVWSSVLDIDPDDERAGRELARIYQREERWEDLLDILSRQVARASDPEEVARLRLRIGELLQHKLGDVHRAVETYRQVLEADPEDTGARGALEGLLDEPDHRRRAAEILEPVFSAGEEHERYARVLEVQLGETDVPDARADLLLRIAAISEKGLDDLQAAYGALARAFPERRGDERILGGLERLAGRLDQWVDLVSVLDDGAVGELDGTALLDLRLRIARIWREELKDFTAARSAYQIVLELDPTHRGALDALEAIYRATAQWPELLTVLRTKADTAEKAQERIGILFQMAEVLREIQDDPDGAVRTYREVLDICEDHEEAIARLTVLFEEGERWPDLEELLARQIAYAQSAAEAARLKHRLGQVRAEHMGNPGGALDIWSEVVREDPDHAPTVEALEHFLAAGVEKGRVAALLEPIYRQREQWKRLVEVLRARRGASEDPEFRVEMSREMSRLLEEFLYDDRAAYRTLLGAYREAPEDRALRGELERLAEQINGFEELADTLEDALDGIGDPEIRLEVLRLLARVCDERLQYYARSREHWRQVLGAEPDDDEALDALERLHTRMEDWNLLVDLYHHKADRTLDGDEKVQIYFKICNLWEEVLDDPNAAIETYRAILTIDPHNRTALSGLERLYHFLERWDDLADLLMQEVSLAETDHQAASIRHRLGELLDERMSRRTESVELFREALETVPGHKRTVTSLEKMLSGFGEGLTEDPGTRRRICEILEEHYRQEGNWLKLVDVFTAQYEDAEDVERKAELLRQIAAIQEQRLHDLQGAFSSLAKGFALRYGDQALREDLERLAGTLNWWERVVNTYLEGIEDVDDPLLAADMLRRLGSIFDEKLGHNENAIEIYRRLLLIEDDAPDALDALERLYTRTGRHEELVGVLHRKALVSPEVLERKELLYRICEIWEDVVGDRDRAIETYRAVREQDPDDLSAVEALERLYRTTGDWVSLVDLYREMAELALEEEERLRCWFEVARLSQEELDDPDGAVDAYRAVLDVEVGNRKALRALEALYEQEGQWASLLDALEMALSATEDADEQIRVRMRMGSLLRHKLDDVPRAVETFRTVLDRQPDHSGALGALEELLADAEWRQAAARVLEPVYDARQDWPRLVGVLAIRATGADDPEARVELLRRQAMIQERHLDAAALACTTLGEALRLQPYSTELADELERLARLEGDLGELVDVLGDVRGAVEDPETFRALSLRMARVLDGDLGRPAAAIDCFEQVRESDPYHLGALDALDRLYRETERWVELGAVIEARMALADPEDATALRFRLGELKERAFEDAAGALECYRQILWDEPGHTGAREALARIGESIELREAVVEVLEPIYRSEGEWRGFI